MIFTHADRAIKDESIGILKLNLDQKCKFYIKSPRSGIFGLKPAFTQIGAILSQTNHGVHMSLWASIKPRYQIQNPLFSLVQLQVDSLRNPVLNGRIEGYFDVNMRGFLCLAVMLHHNFEFTAHTHTI